MLSIFKHNFHKERKKVCLKTRSTSASRPLKGKDTKPTTVIWSIKKPQVISGEDAHPCTLPLDPPLHIPRMNWDKNKGYLFMMFHLFF